VPVIIDKHGATITEEINMNESESKSLKTPAKIIKSNIKKI